MSELEKVLEAKYEVNPDNDQIACSLAEIYLRGGRNNQAISILEQALERKADDPWLLFRLAQVSLRSGFKARAKNIASDLFNAGFRTAGVKDLIAEIEASSVTTNIVQTEEPLHNGMAHRSSDYYLSII